jgi:hypothetical protein
MNNSMDQSPSWETDSLSVGLHNTNSGLFMGLRV